MRHGNAGRKFGRNSSWRKATVRDIARATLLHERVCTTEARAKETRKLVDKLITLGKKQTLAAKRMAFAIIGSHRMVSTLFNETAIRFKDRNGGYSRIIPLAKTRRGDNAKLVFLELTEKAKVVVEKTSKAKKTSVAKKPAEAKATQESAQKTAENSKEKEKKAPSTASQKSKPEEKSSKRIGRGLKKIFSKKNPGK
ncbi:MAG: 50S ribosomal protein L17 [Candidatus Aceula meridiana]|nr:50S ribosomal protein L17 [Candidatus Aceula meridiana]